MTYYNGRTIQRGGGIVWEVEWFCEMVDVLPVQDGGFIGHLQLVGNRVLYSDDKLSQ